MEFVLEAKNVNKYFGGLKANQDLTFNIEKGEIIGLIGPNGSGKTTLINVISGNYPADGGSIQFRGEEILGLKPYVINRLGIARTYQVVQPFVGMNVRECVDRCPVWSERIRSQHDGGFGESGSGFGTLPHVGKKR